jgi:hypothetical protein
MKFFWNPNLTHTLSESDKQFIRFHEIEHARLAKFSSEEIQDLNRQLDMMFDGDNSNSEHIILDPNIVFKVER